MAANNNPTTEVLAGLVERVTFHNEDNGFCVLRVKARGKREPITVVGHAAVISAGEFIQASGEWANDRTHGVQFRARFLKTMPPTTTEGIEKYLGSGMIRMFYTFILFLLSSRKSNLICGEPYDKSRIKRHN